MKAMQPLSLFSDSSCIIAAVCIGIYLLPAWFWLAWARSTPAQTFHNRRTLGWNWTLPRTSRWFGFRARKVDCTAWLPRNAAQPNFTALRRWFSLAVTQRKCTRVSFVTDGGCLACRYLTDELWTQTDTRQLDPWSQDDIVFTHNITTQRNGRFLE